MSFTLTLLLAIVLTVWFLASIMWGSIWFNLVTSSKNAKQQFLSEKARSVADRWGVSIVRFPILHLLIWLANVFAWCKTALFWWHNL